MSNSSFRNLISKFICIAASCVSLLLLISCTDLLINEKNNPRLTWQEFSGYISSSDYSSAFKLTGNSSISLDVPSVSDSELGNLFIQKSAECYDYQFVSETDVLGITAWQEIEITTLDMRKLAKKAVSQVVEDTKVHDYKYGSYKTDDEIADAVRAKMFELIKVPEDCLTTERIRVEFCYKQGKWLIVMDDKLYDIVSGYSSQTNDAISEYLKNQANSD